MTPHAAFSNRAVGRFPYLKVVLATAAMITASGGNARVTVSASDGTTTTDVRRRTSQLTRMLLASLGLLLSQPALADLIYTYDYNFSDALHPGSSIIGELSFTTPTFVNSPTFVPAIYHNDPASHPFLQINFRNAFHGVDGSPLSANPVLDIILDGFGTDLFIGGPINQLGTIIQTIGSGTMTTIISQLPDNFIKYEITYDFSSLSPGIVGNFSFVVPKFITTSSTLFPILHTDPVGEQLEFFGLRNIFQPNYDAAPLGDPPVVDLVLSGFGTDAIFVGPLDHTGTFEKDSGESTQILTISGTAEAVPEPSSLAIVVAGLLGLAAAARRRRHQSQY